eukprot:gene10349-10506_t
MEGGQANPATAWRLKVVGVPEGYSEDQLRQLFSLCGSVVEARLVHDKQSGLPVGYGYVSFFTKEAADLAISTFDDQLQLQGAATFLSVYYAKKQHDTVQEKESCPARNAKLYFCGTPAGFRRDSILALFSAFGRVRHLQVYTDGYGVLSSGTVTMYSTEEATAAMNSLDGKVLQAGTAPLKVTWAQLSTLPRRNPAGGGPPPPMPKGFTVSYACIPTAVTPSEVAAMFDRFGMVLQVVPFAHRREGPVNSRGCGLVVMESEQAAMEAVEALSGKVTWPGAERPLLVQPFYGAERVGPHQLPTLPDGSAGSACEAGPLGIAGRPRSALHQPAARVGSAGGVADGDRQQGPADGEVPPAGCAPDAYKIVLGNLPSSATQADLYAILQRYGSVVQVIRSQGSDPSLDGTASVWYATGAQADAALGALHSTVLMAPDGPRQLTVRVGRGPSQMSRQSRGGRMGLQQHQQGRVGPTSSVHKPMQPMPGRLGPAAGIMPLAQPQHLMAQAAHGQMLFQAQLPPQQQQLVQYAVGPLGNEQYQGQGQAAGPRYAAPGMQLAAAGESVGLPFWQQQPPATAAASGATPPGLMQFGGVPGAQLGPGGMLAGQRGAFDMQQLMYMLPPGGVVQPGPQAAPSHHGLSSGMGPHGVGQLGPVASGHLWAQGSASGGGVLLPGQQHLGTPSLTNSGSMMECTTEAEFLTGAPAASNPQAAYTGWLY